MSDDIVATFGFPDEIREKYFVDDQNIENENCNVIFILESPHTTEIHKKYPAAASSGISMTKILVKNGIIDSTPKVEALGKLIFEKATKNITNFGIMNVCSFPLQPSVYCCKYLEIMTDKNLLTLHSMFLLRSSVKCANNSDCNNTCSKTRQQIVSDFKRRLITIRQNQLVIICGEFAQNFFSATSHQHKNMVKVPHPSRKHWEKPKYRSSIQKMIREIKKNIK